MREYRKNRIFNILNVIFLAALLLGGCGESGMQLTGVPVQTVSETAVKEDADYPVSTDSMVYVHMSGEVNTPGVYELVSGSRLYDGVEAAGGFTKMADSDACNLALVLEDGVQYRIPQLGERTEQTEEADSHYSEDGRLDINLATVEELTLLTGIGETRAAAIVTYRSEHGAFTAEEELMQVPGIKEGLYAQLESQIIVR